MNPFVISFYTKYSLIIMRIIGENKFTKYFRGKLYNRFNKINIYWKIDEYTCNKIHVEINDRFFNNLKIKLLNCCRHFVRKSLITGLSDFSETWYSNALAAFTLQLFHCKAVSALQGILRKDKKPHQQSKRMKNTAKVFNEDIVEKQ